jgi:branched-chain amino acid transport system substrate-binding protein
VVVALVALSALTGCGTRQSAAEVLAAQGGAAVTVALPPGVLGAATAGAPAAVAGNGAGATAPLGASSSRAGAVATGSTAATSTTGAARTGGSIGRAAATGAVTTRSATGSRAGGTAATEPAPSDAATAAAPTTCPAGAAPLKLGQIGHFSGVVGPLTQGARIGLSVWASDVNARGGINCHPVQLFQMDDGADPSRTAANIADLVNDKHVSAIVASFSALAPAAVKQGAEKYKVPVIGGDLAAFEWNSSPYLFPEGASLTTRAYTELHQAVAAGFPKMGLLYCVETPSCTTLHKVVETDGVAKQAGVTVVYSTPVSIAATDYTAQCQNAKNAGAQSIGVAMDGASISRLVRSCDALGFRPPIATDALLISNEQAADPGLRRNTVLSANVTAPWMLSDTPGQRAYQAAMKHYAPGYTLDSSSIIAWTCGKLAEAAIAKLPVTTAAPTSAQIVGGLGQLHNEKLGGLSPGITFRAGQPAPQGRCMYYTRLDEHGWSAPRGSTPVCY